MRLSQQQIEKLLGYYTPKSCKDTADVIDCLLILSKQPQTAQIRKLAERFVKRYGMLRTSNTVADMNHLDRERWETVTNFYHTVFYGYPKVLDSLTEMTYNATANVDEVLAVKTERWFIFFWEITINETKHITGQEPVWADNLSVALTLFGDVVTTLGKKHKVELTTKNFKLTDVGVR